MHVERQRPMMVSGTGRELWCWSYPAQTQIGKLIVLLQKTSFCHHFEGYVRNERHAISNARAYVSYLKSLGVRG